MATSEQGGGLSISSHCSLSRGERAVDAGAKGLVRSAARICIAEA